MNRRTRHDDDAPEDRIGRDAGAGFALVVDPDVRLVLPNRLLTQTIFELESAEQPRLRQWEQWAVAAMTLESTTQRLQSALTDFAAGRRVPTYIEWRGQIVGAVSARIDEWSAAAELGYFVSRRAEGHGLVTRSAGVLVDHVIAALGVQRIYVQASVDNVRSLAVAQRLGLLREGVLRSAWSVGDRPRVDAVLYGLPAADWVRRRAAPD